MVEGCWPERHPEVLLRLAYFGTVLSLLLFASSCDSPRYPYRPPMAHVAPPARVQEEAGPPPGEDHVWIPGRWVRHGDWVWVEGRWVTRWNGARWVPGRWRRHGVGWVWVGGYWKRKEGPDA